MSWLFYLMLTVGGVCLVVVCLGAYYMLTTTKEKRRIDELITGRRVNWRTIFQSPFALMVYMCLIIMLNELTR